ncbi:MAG: TIGR03118 family protein [Acidobacteriia bacterium]|nr:TIGR03118 family protein [Terriglobia bacterium]
MGKHFRVMFTAALGFSLTPVVFATPIGFFQTNLASDQTGVAKVLDPNLINAWGIAASSTSPFWLGANGSGSSVLYNGNTGVKQALVVLIPGDGSVTGVAFNGAAASSFNGDVFLFASEDGTVSGWRGALGTNGEVLALGDPANVYKGLTDANISGDEYAYIANFRAGKIDVLKGSAAFPDLAGNFTDPNLPAGYAPFDIANINGVLYVTYALQDGSKKDDVSGLGNGIVDRFDLQGNLLGRLVTSGALNSPWGLALAPAGFGDVGGNLLVGNFGDGRINAYNPTTGTFVETLRDANGNPLAIDGLWGLAFGNGGNAGPKGTLFFTAGPVNESHGLFGELNTAPEPATWLLTGGSLLVLVLRRASKTRST